MFASGKFVTRDLVKLEVFQKTQEKQAASDGGSPHLAVGDLGYLGGQCRMRHLRQPCGSKVVKVRLLPEQRPPCTVNMPACWRAILGRMFVCVCVCV